MKGRGSRGSNLKTHRIPILATVTTQAVIALPANCRVHHVTGEASGKPTYDFQVNYILGTAAGVGTYNGRDYFGTPSGRSVNLARDYPLYPTYGGLITGIAAGQTLIQIVPAANTTLVVYYEVSSATAPPTLP